MSGEPSWKYIQKYRLQPHQAKYYGIFNVMVGSWLVYCLVIYTGFESELISHLTVNKARTRPPETVDDLVNADGWKWGIDALIWTGVPLEYFTRHKNPAVVEVNKHMERYLLLSTTELVFQYLWWGRIVCWRRIIRFSLSDQVSRF
ncbi:hypothetical protein Pcinc_003460 [Petrolisthes cinctipes]|uniref:Uncharacterized protein n=1 Tax=Petrolisthes cinctipes TaxID=88211 RepID=A0AAE1GIX6_PETCI|nr:hypothetical protein Pcinc_003460 [Petrolisthes cinctipes]